MGFLENVNLEKIQSKDDDIVDVLFYISGGNSEDNRVINMHKYDMYNNGVFLRYRNRFDEPTRQEILTMKSKESYRYADSYLRDKVNNVVNGILNGLYNELICRRRECIAELLQTGKLESVFEFDGSNKPKLFEYEFDISESTLDDLKVPEGSRCAIVSINTFKKIVDLIGVKLGIGVIASKYYKDNIITFLPTLHIGELLIGITPEEADNYNRNNYKTKVFDNTGIAVSCFCPETSPSNLEMIISTLFLPKLSKGIEDQIKIVKIKDDK